MGEKDLSECVSVCLLYFKLSEYDSANMLKPRLISPQFKRRLYPIFSVSLYPIYSADVSCHGHPGNNVNMCHHFESKVNRKNGGENEEKIS